MEPEFGPLFDQINYSTAAHIDSVFNAHGSVKEKFTSWWIGFARYSNEKPFDLIYMDQLATSHLYPLFGSQPSTSFYKKIGQIVKEGQDLGLIKKVEISQINQFVRCALIGVIKTNISTGKKTSEEQIVWMVETCWDGIKTS